MWKNWWVWNRPLFRSSGATATDLTGMKNMLVKYIYIFNSSWVQQGDAAGKNLIDWGMENLETNWNSVRSILIWTFSHVLVWRTQSWCLSTHFRYNLYTAFLTMAGSIFRYFVSVRYVNSNERRRVALCHSCLFLIQVSKVRDTEIGWQWITSWHEQFMDTAKFILHNKS